jgi:hypothetical protein
MLGDDMMCFFEGQGLAHMVGVGHSMGAVATMFARKVNGVVAKMRVGPSEPPFRRRLQTAHCCCVQKAWW